MASNTLITPTWVTREALRILHEQLAFTNTTHNVYDDSYSVGGAKRGDTLSIRLPNKYTVRTGAAMSTQNTEEESVALTTATQKGVDVEFSSVELALEQEDFSRRIIRPAMSVLASDIEYDYLSNMTKQVNNQFGTAGTTPAALNTFLQARKFLNQELAPKGDRCIQMSSTTSASMVNALSGLFHESTAISKQYSEGMMGRTAGADWYENERTLTLTQGADVVGAINDAGATIASGDTAIPVDGYTAALTVGTVINFAGVNAVHPETKQSYGRLMNFVVTAATTTQLTVSPAIHSTGAKQNVDALPADNAAVTLPGAEVASTAYPYDLLYHPEAFAFTTADLPMPNGVDWSAREVMDGISMRIIRDYTISTDQFPCRIDVLYGYKAIRPELSCRIVG